MNIETVRRCRACLNIGYDMCHLLEKSSDTDITNLEILQQCTSIQITRDESWPQYLCKLCVQKANESYLFKLQCEKSQEQLWIEYNIKYEIKNEAQALESRSSVSQQSNKQKQHVCEICNKEFKCRTSVVKHRREHNNERRSCSYCNATLPSAILLARHMDEEHANMKSIKCSLCDKTFFKQANLRLHMNVHSGIKRHMCEMCGMSFALAGNLAAHRRLHTGLKPYTCKQCGRGFTQQAALRSHEAGHSNTKDHVCTDCGAAFSRAGALRNHQKRHQSIKPFTCSICNKAFTFSSERKRHMIIHTGEKNFQCDICGSRFNRRTNLSVHRRIHTGEAPHICSTCGKRFNQAHSLRTHISIHTGTKDNFSDTVQ